MKVSSCQLHCSKCKKHRNCLLRQHNAEVAYCCARLRAAIWRETGGPSHGLSAASLSPGPSFRYLREPVNRQLVSAFESPSGPDLA